MQKKLIALAIAGLSTAAFADSANVVVYGAMDATYDNVSADGATTANSTSTTYTGVFGAGNTVTTTAHTTTTGNNYASRGRINMNSSYFGLKGTEAIGNGLAVAWQIESGIGGNGGGTNTVGASTYGLATRDTYIGLAGGFGTIAAGTLTGPARALGAAMDVNAGATGVGNNGALIGKLGGGSGAGYFDTRFANTIAYISPNMGGATVVVAYVPNANKGTDGATSSPDTVGETAGVNYSNGPIFAGYAYTQIKDSGTGFGPINTGLGGQTIEKVENNRIAGKYDFGMATVGLMYDATKATLHGSGTEVKQNVIYVPVSFTIGSGKIIAQYGTASKVKVAGSDVADSAAKHVVVGYEYSLSKRTILKAVYSQISNDAAANFDFLYPAGTSGAPSTAPGVGPAAGVDPKAISVGIRHNF